MNTVQWKAVENAPSFTDCKIVRQLEISQCALRVPALGQHSSAHRVPTICGFRKIECLIRSSGDHYGLSSCLRSLNSGERRSEESISSQ